MQYSVHIIKVRAKIAFFINECSGVAFILYLFLLSKHLFYVVLRTGPKSHTTVDASSVWAGFEHTTTHMQIPSSTTVLRAPSYVDI